MIKKLTYLLLTLLVSATSSWGATKQVEVDLSQDMFHHWTAADATGQDDGTTPFWNADALGTSTQIVYGNTNVTYVEYADLAAYSKLVITTTEGTPRCMFNRVVDGGTVQAETPRDAKYQTEENGVYTIDLAAIKADFGFVHLHSIKGANWANVTVTSMKLVQTVEVAAGTDSYKPIEKLVYFNDFSSTEGLAIVGNGMFEKDADARFGKVYHNDYSVVTEKSECNLANLPATSENTTWDAATNTFAWTATWYNSTEIFPAGDYSAYTTFNYTAEAGTTNHFRLIIKCSDGSQRTLYMTEMGTISKTWTELGISVDELKMVTSIRLSGANDVTGSIKISSISLSKTEGTGLTKAIRKNYLVMPTTCLSGSQSTKEMSIGFWVNSRNTNVSDYYWSPLFSAYAKMPNDNGVNEAPMFICQARGIVQVSSNGWCNFDAAQNDLGANTETVDWLSDGNWHYYTITMTETRVIVYVDGDVLNSWSINEEPGQHIAGLFTSPENLPYICLGGNQAWDWPDADPAFAFDDFAVYRYALDRNQIKEIIANKLTVNNPISTEYTINYLKGTCDNCTCATPVKTVTGTDKFVGGKVIADRIITGDDNNYYITNDNELPSMILSEFSDENVLNVYVHTPRTAEIYINYQFGNNEPTEYKKYNVSELTDENTSDANFTKTYYFPAYKYCEKEDIWYQTRSTDYCHHFTFTDDFTRVYQTIAYTLPDADVVFFTEGPKNSSGNSKYSDKYLSFVPEQTNKAEGTYVWHYIEPQLSGVNYVDGLNEGAYEMIAKTFSANKKNIALRNADNPATPIAEIVTNTVSSNNLLGAGFILKDNSYKNLIINGGNKDSKAQQSEDFDWIVIKKANPVICEAVENGTITADKVACSAGMPVKVTLAPAANCKLVSARVYDDFNHTVASVTEGTSFIFTMPADNVRITATFKSTEEARPTQITEVNAENGESAVLYNMAGQRVNANAKGLVIKNGKKAIIK